jgi:hypothetical protein
MDWGNSSLGKLLGSEYQVIYFFSASGLIGSVGNTKQNKRREGLT